MVDVLVAAGAAVLVAALLLVLIPVYGRVLHNPHRGEADFDSRFRTVMRLAVGFAATVVFLATLGVLKTGN
jgi:hypothetical protein